ncbi:MAG: cytochrome P450, partial [Sneathiella sp.]|nr:cytochrome P450 [Sneathiella sp.]
YYAELRSKGPFVYIPKYSVLACGRYDVTKEVFSDHNRFVSSRGVGLQDFKLAKAWRPPSIILEADPPDHSRTRKVMARAMSPKAIADLKSSFQIAANDLIDELLRKPSFDAVIELAEAYPTTVFPAAVGLRNTDSRRLVDYGAMVFNALGPNNEIRQNAMAKGPDIVPWITENCKRKNLISGGIGDAIYAAADAGDITVDEAGMLVRSLLSAGVDTTVTAIGNALWCLANNPNEYSKLAADPELARPAFEETMRYTSPVHSFCRTANMDTEVAGINLKQGSKIICVLGAANLDENRWENADRFEINRRTTGHLALGVGVHRCVGQNIARAEGQAILSAIANKVSSINFESEVIWRPNNAIRALEKMQISFKPKG